MSSTKQSSSADRRLTLDDVLPALLTDGLITKSQVEELHFRAKQIAAEGVHPLTTIADQGWPSAAPPHLPLDIERLMRWLADKVQLEYLRIDPLKIDVASVTGVLKHSYATRFGILPVAVNGDDVTIAIAEPYIREWERELQHTLGLRFSRVIANPTTINRYLAEFYAISSSITGATNDRKAGPLDSVSNLEQLVDLGSTTEPDADDQHVVRIVDWLLQYAFDQRASDIHLEPRRDQGNIRFRIDGVLHLVNQIPTPVLAAVVSRLKALGRLDLVERRRPQDGRVKTKSQAGQEVELRLSTMPTAFGEKLVMRIFDPDVLVKSFEHLGFSRRDIGMWEHMVDSPHGMVVVTGPTGSGKTTTLYSVLKSLAKPELNICSIEDPIELVDAQFNQMHVQHNIGLDFATGVRTLLRQDPDIIMVGEIRDSETADCAIQAALTGHLVLTTLHTNDAPSTITRFLDLGVPPYLLKSALLGVVAQRLVRTLCPTCKKTTKIRPEDWKSLIGAASMRPPTEIAKAVGCDECRHTGYLGRIGLYEIMPIGDTLRDMITGDTDVAALRKAATDEGMRPLRISGAQKVQAALTTPSEVLKVIQDTND